MGVVDRAKWFFIRRWPWGYRKLSRVYQGLFDREYLEEQARVTAFLRPFIDPGDLCFDVGANRGRRSEALLALGAWVVAVEPQPVCLKRLRARFGHEDRFRIEAVALGDAPGTAQLQIGRDDQISTLARDFVEDAEQIPELAAIGWQGTLEVPVTTLDALVERHGVPRFTKIDVEGFEDHVVAGLSRPLPLVSLEYTQWRLDPVLAAVERLETLGDYRFNLSEGETMEWALPAWVPGSEIRELLRTTYARQEDGYGDVYARLASEIS